MPNIETAATARTSDFENDELAGVVIASETTERTHVPWYIVLRPWLFCLAFLVVAEIAARLYFDTTLCLQPERLDNYPNAAMENVFLAQIHRDPAYKVVIIGDSTVVGASLLDKSETIPRLLETELNHLVRGRRIHVWNMSIQGARATDDWCLLQRVLETKPDFVIIEANYFISDGELFRQPLMNPWLAYNLTHIPTSLQPLVPKRDWKRLTEDRLTDSIEQNIRFVGLRQAINVKLFGVQPRHQPFDIANPAVMEAVTIAKRLHKLQPQSWKATGLNPKDPGWVYHYAVRSITPNNINGQFYREIIGDLERSKVNAITYLTPQNPAITHSLMSPQWYANNRTALIGFLHGNQIPCFDYCDLVPDRFFNDNDHMLPDGNRILATALAQAIAPQVMARIH